MSDVTSSGWQVAEAVETPSMWRALRDLLVRREKFWLIVTLGMTITNSFFEIAALAVLLPLTNQLLGGDSKSIGFLEDLFPDSTTDASRLLVIVAVVILVYVVKNLFSLTLVYVQQRLGAAIANRLVQHLFTVYISRPYGFHLRTNSSLLIRNVQENSASLLAYVISPILTILTDLSVALAMLGLLLYIEPGGTAATVVVFLLGTWLFLRLTRSLTDRWGEVRNQARQDATKALLQGLGGVKEIKLAGREAAFLDEHRVHQHRSQRATYLFATFQQFPRAVFETLAFLGVGVLVVVLLAAGRPASDAVGVLAIFAGAAFRILPSLQRVTGSFQSISFGQSMVHSVYHDLREEPHVGPEVVPTKPIAFSSLQLQDVTFAYEAAHREALSNITLHVAKGEYVGVIGSSGAGKSTLIDVLLGLLHPNSGELLVNGTNVAGDITAWQRVVGYVPQEIYLLDDSIRRNVALDIRDDRIDDTAIEEALRAAQLWEFVMSLPDGLDTETGERGVRLSGGQRQRLGIARALYRNPQVLVFDEATSALDSQTESEVVDAIERLRGERTVIIVAHRLSTVRHCDTLYMLESGRIVRSGSYDEVVGASEQR
jgi:ABC-type multidrug transport system fused ATPase/permease subunit